MSPAIEMNGLTLLGQSGAPSQKKLEAFPAPASTFEGTDPLEIRFTAPEFTSFCPVTGQPDFGSIEIRYVPDQRCLESKSLKLYLQTFRSALEFWEALAVMILDDLVDALEPHFCTVIVRQNPRGGISLECTATYSASPAPPRHATI